MDIQILGIAIANRAESIVTRDAEIKKIIEALDLPIQILNFDEQSYFDQMVYVNKPEVMQ